MRPSFSSEWLEWKKENIPTQATDKTDKRASVSNVSSSLEHSENEITDRWKLFYPDLDPGEWEIIHTVNGAVCGKKVKGQLSGTIGFYLPADRFREVPAPKTRSRVEEWDFRKERIGNDFWMVGKGLHKTGVWQWWFIGNASEKDIDGETPSNVTGFVPKQKELW